jgi:hypothetical protein
MLLLITIVVIVIVSLTALTFINMSISSPACTLSCSFSAITFTRSSASEWG